MKKVFIALTAIIAMASCKKENVATVVTPPVTSAKKLVKSTYVYDNATPETEIFNYDAQGRIATIKGDESTETFEFLSASSLVVTERFNNNNAVAAIRECSLNDKGYITKIVVKNSVGNISGTYDYIYNADGYMTNSKLTYPSGNTSETIYVISDGNMVSSKLYQNNVLSNNSQNTYDVTKVNKTGLSYANYWSLSNCFGKSAKNLMSESKSYNAANTLTWHVQFSYDIDADGFPIKLTSNYLLQNKAGVDTYVYQ
jgi:hypothetical protein